MYFVEKQITKCDKVKYFYLDSLNFAQKESFRKLDFSIAGRYWSYYLYNTQTSLTIVEKITGSIVGGLLIPSLTWRIQQTQSCSQSNPQTHQLILFLGWGLVYQMFKDEPSYLCPDSSQARLSLVIFPTTTWGLEIYISGLGSVWAASGCKQMGVFFWFF